MLSPALIELLSKLDSKCRPLALAVLPFRISSAFYSNARKVFIKTFSNAQNQTIHIPTQYNTKIWDIDFNVPIFNATGMFKNAEGYYTCAKMGAGAFLAGTTTQNPRRGNTKLCVKHPFMPYSNSFSASNWMGLPNNGHEYVAKTISNIQKIKLCPIGASLAESPDTTDDIQKAKEVVEGIKLYEKAGVDFIELNFSCPNVTHKSSSSNTTSHNLNNKCELDASTVRKLSYISDNYLKKRTHNVPVIAKYSNDITAPELLATIDILIEFSFDGINVGNTSTKYSHYSRAIHPKDIKLFDKFTTTFGGGLSGNLLKHNSLSLCKSAMEYIRTKKLSKEFHVIRTGGISEASDIIESQKAGIALNQWFTGFFEYFANSGFCTYQALYSEMDKLLHNSKL